MDYAIGGFGTGEGLASQGSLQRSSDGRYLLAVDAGSNQISVLRIKSDGSLKRVGRRLVSSSGVNPVSIAVRGHLVNVANAGTATSSGGTNYTGFTLNPGSHLRPLAGSTVGLPDASQPGDVLLSPDGRKLVGTRVATAVIDSFTVQRDRRLTAAPGSPFAAQGLGPFGSQFRPTTRRSSTSPMEPGTPRFRNRREGVSPCASAHRPWRERLPPSSDGRVARAPVAGD